MGGITWSYGVTTIPLRRTDYLPKTLESLARAGFDRPRLFVDGSQSDVRYRDFGELETTFHYPAVRLYGNWILALWELFLRNPGAQRYALFQDDLLACTNLRQYLERVPYPKGGGYLNLFSSPANELGCKKDRSGKPVPGFYPANQNGRGAVALVFDRSAVRTILTHEHTFDHVLEAKSGWKSIDGAVVTVLSERWKGAKGSREYVHYPSLTQHTGVLSSVGHNHPQSNSFPGVDFDCLTLLKDTVEEVRV